MRFTKCYMAYTTLMNVGNNLPGINLPGKNPPRKNLLRKKSPRRRKKYPRLFLRKGAPRKKSPCMAEKISPVVEKISPPIFAENNLRKNLSARWKNLPRGGKNLPLFMGRTVLIKTYSIHVCHSTISCVKLRGRC